MMLSLKAELEFVLIQVYWSSEMNKINASEHIKSLTLLDGTIAIIPKCKNLDTMPFY